MASNGIKTMIPKGFVFSQSSLQEYSDCPRRFQLRFIEQLHWPAVETEPVLENERRQIEGQVFHRIVQQHLIGLPPGKISRLANMSNLDTWWKNFQAFIPDLNGYTKYAELTLSSPIGEYRLVAKYDLLAFKPGEKALIFDWKTYTRRPRDEVMAARWQTRVYRSLLAKAGIHLNNNLTIESDQIEMKYWYADFPSEPARFPYNDQQFKRDWSAIEKVVKEISSTEEFPMTDDESICRFCVYRSFCDRGKQAANFDEEKLELEPDSTFELNFEQIGEIEF
jgi:CRISPR/Cas system-associated exonuclease Cas4 (RecB family)